MEEKNQNGNERVSALKMLMIYPELESDNEFFNLWESGKI